MTLLREQEALRERDLRQVYDTSIKVNLEELALQEALALVHAQVRSLAYSPPMPCPIEHMATPSSPASLAAGDPGLCALPPLAFQVGQGASAGGKRQKMQQRASQLLSAMQTYRPAPASGGQKVGQRSLNVLAAAPVLADHDHANNNGTAAAVSGASSNNSSDSKGEA